MKRQYTLKHESERLLEAGLNPESADGWVDDSNRFETMRNGMSLCISWSVGRIIELLPPSVLACGDEYLLKMGKSVVPTDNGYAVEEYVAYGSGCARLSGDFIGFSTMTDKCDFLDCLVNMLCWVAKNTHISRYSGVCFGVGECGKPISDI